MGQFNDGGLPFGSRKVSIYPSASADASGATTWASATLKGVYILESFTPTRPTSKVTRKDENGKPNGAFAQDDFASASAVIQLPYVTSPLIDASDAFTSARRGNAGALECWAVESVDDSESQDGIRKQSVRLHKLTVSPSANWAPSGAVGLTN